MAKKRGRGSKRAQTQLGGIAAIVVGLALFLYRGGYLNQFLPASGNNVAISSTTSSDNTIDSKAYATLAKLDFASGDQPVLKVNQGQSTLNTSIWKTAHIDYGALDKLNRTTTATAYLDQGNLGHSEGRPAQDWTPTGWHYNRGGGTEIYNRGHLIAYTLTFNLNADGQAESGAEGSSDNPKNLGTQSAYSNQVLMQIYEGQVRTAMSSGKKLVYQVTTVFRDSELMPRGYWLQAKSTDGSVNFNVYIYNVQPGYQFNYLDGSSKIDSSMKVDESGLDK